MFGRPTVWASAPWFSLTSPSPVPIRSKQPDTCHRCQQNDDSSHLILPQARLVPSLTARLIRTHLTQEPYAAQYSLGEYLLRAQSICMWFYVIRGSAGAMRLPCMRTRVTESLTPPAPFWRSSFSAPTTRPTHEATNPS